MFALVCDQQATGINHPNVCQFVKAPFDLVKQNYLK